MAANNNEFLYPRRVLFRRYLKMLARLALATLTDFYVVGLENLPKGGPLLVVGNHFSFIDPVAIARISPWPIEFLGGFDFPHAPSVVRWIPRSWGYYPLFRGTGSTYALRAGEEILKQKGVLAIFPEGGNWATVLRPARPGAAFLAARTGAQILPIGIDGLTNVFPSLRKGNRARVSLSIGKPFGPLKVNGRGRERRRQLNEFGHKIMQRIAELIPPESRGHYSDDPAIREAARGTEIYPWADKVEGQVIGEVH